MSAAVVIVVIVVFIIVIFSSLSRAMSSERNKELFLSQVEQILEGVKQDKEKVLLQKILNYKNNEVKSVLLFSYCVYVFVGAVGAEEDR